MGPSHVAEVELHGPFTRRWGWTPAASAARSAWKWRQRDWARALEGPLPTPTRCTTYPAWWPMATCEGLRWRTREVWIVLSKIYYVEGFHRYGQQGSRYPVGPWTPRSSHPGYALEACYQISCSRPLCLCSWCHCWPCLFLGSRWMGAAPNNPHILGAGKVEARSEIQALITQGGLQKEWGRRKGKGELAEERKTGRGLAVGTLAPGSQQKVFTASLVVPQYNSPNYIVLG